MEVALGVKWVKFYKLVNTNSPWMCDNTVIAFTNYVFLQKQTQQTTLPKEGPVVVYLIYCYSLILVVISFCI